MGDLLGFLNVIEKRKKREALLSLAIIHNPFSKDPNTLFRELREDTEPYKNGIDRVGIDDLKNKLNDKSKFIKVKNGKSR